MKKTLKITSIEIVLTNRESFIFSPRDVRVEFACIGVSAGTMGIMNWGEESPKTYFVKEAEIYIRKNAKCIEYVGDSENWLKRINRDITGVCLHYSDGTIEFYSIPWDEEDWEHNLNEQDRDEDILKIYTICKGEKIFVN